MMEYLILAVVVALLMLAVAMAGTGALYYFTGLILSGRRKRDKLLEELADLETLRDKMKVEGYFFSDILDIEREIDKIRKELGI